MQERTSEGAAQQAAEVAAGSGVVFAGNLFNRGLRLLTNWYLSGALGAAGYGLYELARTVVTILASLAPLGADRGVLLFGARYRSSGEQERLKGTLLACFGMTLVAGPLLSLATAVAVIVFKVGSEHAGLDRALLIALPSVSVWALLILLVSVLRSAKDMWAQSLSYLVVLPLGMLVGSVVPVWMGWGLDGVLWGFVLANVVALLTALPKTWRLFGALLTDASITPQYEVRRLLEYSLPESLSSMLFRINQWTDTLMVAALCTASDVGLYRVAVSLAMIGELPSVAINTMFQPVVAELVYSAQMERLREVVRIVTRWLILLAAPVYIVMYVGQDVLLSFYEAEYASTGAALSVLVWGQAAAVITVPVTSLIPMSGRSRLNLINALAAAGLNVVLNALFIPRWGFTGASVATAITLVAWSGWRIAQVWWLMRCQAFSLRSLGLLGVSVAVALLGRGLAVDRAMWLQATVTTASVLVFAAFAWFFGMEDSDEVVTGPALRRLRRRLGRGK